MGGSSNAWAVLFGIGTTDDESEESRAFMQRRVAQFLGVLSAIFLMVYVAALGFTFADQRAVRGQLLHPMRVVHLVVMLGTIGLWLVTRRGSPALRQLAVTDQAFTIFIGVCYAVVRVLTGSVMPTYEFVIVLAYTLIVRAAFIPSRPSRTLFVSFAAGLPMPFAAYFTRMDTFHLRTGDLIRVALPPAAIGYEVFSTALWVSIAVALTTWISFVMYGLHRRIAEAQQLGQYTLEEKIGEGGMGVVYRARHAMLRRPTAVKLLPPERTGATTLARFEREVQLTAKLTHPNTIAIFDYGRTPDGVFYYAMELLEGLDLEALVAMWGPLPPARVVHILEQVAAALVEAHSAGLIHRDIKPANLILCERGGVADFVKVVDFGLVKDTSPHDDVVQSGAHAVVGTPLYMSPEAIVDPQSVDGRSDLYALGAVGYFLLAGRPVFEGTTLIETCAKHLHEPVPPLDDTVPAPLRDVILSCLAKLPDDRPSSARALLEQLEALDLPAWAARDSSAWWERHRADVQVRRRAQRGSTSNKTLGVDFSRREAVV